MLYNICLRKALPGLYQRRFLEQTKGFLGPNLSTLDRLRDNIGAFRGRGVVEPDVKDSLLGPDSLAAQIVIHDLTFSTHRHGQKKPMCGVRAIPSKLWLIINVHCQYIWSNMYGKDEECQASYAVWWRVWISPRAALAIQQSSSVALMKSTRLVEASLSSA